MKKAATIMAQVVGLPSPSEDRMLPADVTCPARIPTRAIRDKIVVSTRRTGLL